MSNWSGLNLQDANSSVMEQLIMFHDHTMMIVLMITIMVGYMMMLIVIKTFNSRFTMENQMIEFTWTVLPAVMLVFIALPSLKILYMMEETGKPLISIKTIGNQWFWSYEYSDFSNIMFDSYMMPLKDSDINKIRLLETDNKVVIPYNTQTRILMTSYDVIHSWTIPVLGIKIDASPGRINQGNLIMPRPGVFFGQCSEICGANHSFMPIMLESVSINSFMNWIKSY
uniref:Cytochrome c oxidase subunit 2 n=1 Tax=Eupteryx gracilirama TaxID=2879584 RepID=A0A8K2APJ7_9HEMI|nr:cytochrome c oxidase subunit II [Eupteryx gracilirama]